VDPYAGEGYDLPADLILVTHQHDDHNHVELPARKPDCQVITNVEALAGGQHNSFDLGWCQVESTYAANANHDPKECVGYIITLDGKTVYASGDTSKYAAMADLAARHLDWCLLPIDGVYNMGPAEAAECAEMIGAQHTVPIHMKPGRLFDLRTAGSFKTPSRLILQPGSHVEL
jgi:L-ascorbate metabolism protein UlaG (beta-lactamase superfamily)